MFKCNNKSIKITFPNIAQLAERLTVEVMWRSGGHRFDSGCSDTFFIFLLFGDNIIYYFIIIIGFLGFWGFGVKLIP